MAVMTPEAIDAAFQRMHDQAFGRDEAQALLDGLSAHLEMERLVLNEDGAAEMTVDGDLDVSLLHIPPLPGLVVAAAVADEGAEIARRLLQANLSFELTQGGSFVMLPGQTVPMLCRLITVSPDNADQLDRELALFVELVRAWRDELDDFEDGDEQDTSAPRPPEHFLRV